MAKKSIIKRNTVIRQSRNLMPILLSVVVSLMAFQILAGDALAVYIVCENKFGGSVRDEGRAISELADGSLLVSKDEISDHPGCASDAVNSVGAGDSFTAALCMGLLKGNPLDAISEHANRVAAFVCSQDSATPVLPKQLIFSRESGTARPIRNEEFH